MSCRADQEESKDGEAGSSSEGDSDEITGSDSEVSNDGDVEYPITAEDTIEITKFLVGLCQPNNFQNDAAVAKFGEKIFSSLHKDLSDLCRLVRIPNMEPNTDILTVGPNIYNFPRKKNQSHKMLLYA